MNEKFIKIALKEAKKAKDIGEIPVGAVIVRNGIIISKAHNLKESNNCVLDHAEIISIKKANKKLNDWRLDNCTLYTTLFPCPMCASAIQQSRISEVVYICNSNNQYIDSNSKNILTNSCSNHVVKVTKYDYNTNLLYDFFKKLRKK